MWRALRVSVFVGLAFAAHLAFFAARPPQGIQAAGSGGEAAVTLIGAIGSVSELVEAWETPPETVEVEPPPALDPPASAPEMNTPPVDNAVAPPLPDLAPQSSPAQTFVAPQAAGAAQQLLAPDAGPMIAPSAGAAPDLPSLATALTEPERAAPAIQAAAVPTLPEVDTEAPPPPDLPEPEVSDTQPPPQAAPPPPVDPLALPTPAPLPQRRAPSAQRPEAVTAPQPPAPDTAPASQTRPVLQSERPRARPEPQRATASPPRPQEQSREVRPAPSSPSSPSVRAQGSGSGQASGQSGAADVSTLSAAQQASAMQRWGARIHRSIQRAQRYPRSARRAAGTAVVALTLTPGGQLRGARLVRSSGNATLDQAALQAVRRVGRYPSAPDGLSASAYPFQLPVRFEPR